MIYSFRNKNDGEIITLEMRMADREPFLEACPELEQIITKMHLADPLMLGKLPAHAKDFQRNVIGRMAEAIPGNNLKEQMRHFGNTTDI